jgi:putative ATP-dependent endonuclease of OLD family
LRAWQTGATIYEEKIDDGTETKVSLLKKADTAFQKIQTIHATEEARCSAIYKLFNRASKAIAAQHLIDFIDQRFDDKSLDVSKLRDLLPTYVVHAIEYATQGSSASTTSPIRPVTTPTVPNFEAVASEETTK